MSKPLLIQLVNLISQAADRGEPMPLVQELTDTLGVSHATVSRLIAEAEREGLIRQDIKPNGRRRIEVVETGRMTDWNHSAGLKKPKIYAGEKLPEHIRRAKTHIQRRGYPVYRAKVADPKADPDLWVVGSFRSRLTDADLLTFARQIGWKESAA